MCTWHQSYSRFTPLTSFLSRNLDTFIAVSVVLQTVTLELRSVLGYSCAVLVIWPPSSDFNIRYGTKDVKAACDALLSFTPETPRQENERLVQFALARCTQNPALVAKALCHAAIVWKEPSLWVRAVSACSKDIGFAIFPGGHESIWDAISSFGFEPTQSGYAVILISYISCFASADFLRPVA